MTVHECGRCGRLVERADLGWVHIVGGKWQDDMCERAIPEYLYKEVKVVADTNLVVRLPIYQKDGGMDTGDYVEIPLPLLRRMVVPIRVFDLDMRIVKKGN